MAVAKKLVDNPSLAISARIDGGIIATLRNIYVY